MPDLPGPTSCIAAGSQQRQDCWGRRPPSQEPPAAARYQHPCEEHIYFLCHHQDQKIPPKQMLFSRFQRTNNQVSRRSTYLGLRVQVCGVGGDAQLHCPRFYGNHSYRYSSQPASTETNQNSYFYCYTTRPFFQFASKYPKETNNAC